ncbi:hypothetical protein [Granulicella paludicola]|jgi:hypothetical protein|uniref:hypothetical protein n=1 Tax=Granulicella paludicola TaxID=474951 RepID=UPI0021DFE0F8|nr:hypothetical protein [Granulicella paludicola]
MIRNLVAGSIFLAASMTAFGQAATPAVPAPTSQAPVTQAPPTAVIPTNGTWKVTGDVQGVSVAMTCALTLGADKAITGTCTDNTGSTSTPHPVTGTVKDQTLSWSFNSDYQGTPITVGLTGTVDPTATKMSGTIAVDPMNADGDFTAVLQVAA